MSGPSASWEARTARALERIAVALEALALAAPVGHGNKVQGDHHRDRIDKITQQTNKEK